MWQIENFVQILWEAKLDPENVLNDKQKQILASAEYFENLNSSTAYFPSVPLDNLQWEQAPETYEGEEEEVEGEGDAVNDGQIPPVQEAPVNEEEDHIEPGQDDAYGYDDDQDMIEVEDA